MCFAYVLGIINIRDIGKRLKMLQMIRLRKEVSFAQVETKF
jgi:hypothetical protein